MSTHRTALQRLGSELGELVARHETAADLSEFKRYESDPLGFASEVLGVKLWSAQVEMLEALRDHRQTAVLGGQGIGKDFAGAVGALWWVFARRGLVLATAATQRQAMEILHAEIVRLFKRAPDLPGEAYRSALRVPGDGGVISFVSTEAAKATGFHHARLLGLASEAQALEGWSFEALRSCAVGPDDRLLCLSNPLVCSGPLYTAAQSGRWQVLKVPATDHPNIRENRTIIAGGPSKEWLEEMRATYGESSSIYRSRVLAEWPEGEEEGLILRRWLDSAAESWPEMRELHAEEVPVVAVDPARYGADSTVCAVRRGDVLERLVSWAGVDLMQTVERVVQVCEEVGVTAYDATGGEKIYDPWSGWSREGVPAVGTVVVDEVGLGGGVLDRLVELGFSATGFNSGRSAHDADRFANRRAESYWHLRERLEAGELAMPRDDALFDELLATRWRPTPDGKIAIESKDALKARLGRSPDRADAVAMAFAPASTRERYVLTHVVATGGDYGITL